MKHTPGPWRIVVDEENGPYVRQAKLTRANCSTVVAWEIQCAADAILISEAPEMAKMLNRCWNILQGLEEKKGLNPEDLSTLQDLSSLILKITGVLE